MPDFAEVLQKRRAVRDYLDQEAPLDVVKEIIAETCLAPSAGNGQPWRFIVIRSRDLIKRLSDESKANLLTLIEEKPDAPIKKYETILRNKDFNVFYNAPCLVYIVGPRAVGSLSLDCSLAAAYFMMSAAARGLGTCWVDLGSNIRSEGLLAEIGLPAPYKIVAPLIIGYPKSIPSAPPRNEPEILKIIS
ncbi:MAG: nitroreductase family protein [Pseudomonadota bacterium]